MVLYGQKYQIQVYLNVEGFKVFLPPPYRVCAVELVYLNVEGFKACRTCAGNIIPYWFI